MPVLTNTKMPIYNCVISIIVENEDDIENSYKRICKKCNMNFEAGNMEGAVISGDMDKYYLLLNKSHLSHNLIGHELYHLLYHILKDRAITDEESSAWISGYLNNLIYKTLERQQLYPFA